MCYYQCGTINRWKRSGERMPIEMKRGAVELHDHDSEWEVIARETIGRLWRLFGSAAKDIQHVGSTAITLIKAKPIIDIAVAVDSFEAVTPLIPALEKEGWTKSRMHTVANDMLFVDDDEVADTRTHHIHVVIYGSAQWHNYINLRDYLNACPEKARTYEKLKIELAEKYPDDRNAYTVGKEAFMNKCLTEASLWAGLLDIAGYDKFVKIEPVTKGWSDDKKYYVETAANRRMLLRVSDVSELDRKKAEYEMMKRVYRLGVLTSEPLGFGLCDGGKRCYSLSSWIDGEDAEKALPLMSETEQYMLGLIAGEALRKIHTLSAPAGIAEWQERYFAVMDERIAAFHDNRVNFENDTVILDYLKNNRQVIKNRSQCFRHSDYSIGNLMITVTKDISVVDWEVDDFDNFGDTWLDFTDVVWGADKSPHFASGVINGYFDGEPPKEFWEVLMYYVFTGILTSLARVANTHEDALSNEIRLFMEALRWFEYTKNPVPTWYLRDLYYQWIDGVPLQLKTPFDLDFVHQYGTVFKVFDTQDSGNLCFGVENGGKRYFIKFAGAPTARYNGQSEDAITRLKETVPIYQDLAHPNLIRFIKAEEIGGGFALIFEWVDAVCAQMMYPADYQKFRELPLGTKNHIFEDIMAFHAFVAEKGYVAIDFYDGSIMWDAGNERTIICDIDFYQKSPYVGRMGLWGSTRFVSPEERTDGAVIDEVTNVYTMGATAFCLFANSNRSPDAWPLSPERYAVVKKAISDERDQRQQSIEQLIAEWRAAK